MKTVLRLIILIFCFGYLSGVSNAQLIQTKYNGSYYAKTTFGEFEAQISGTMLTASAFTPGRTESVSFAAAVSSAGKITGINITGTALANTAISVTLTIDGRRITIFALATRASSSALAPSSLSGLELSIDGDEIEEDDYFDFFSDLTFGNDDDELYYTYVRTSDTTATIDMTFDDDEDWVSVKLKFTSKTGGTYTWVDNFGDTGSGVFSLGKSL